MSGKLRILTLLNCLQHGGTEKAAVLWAIGLQRRGHDVLVVARTGGHRREALSQAGIPLKILSELEVQGCVQSISSFSPDIVHVHSLGYQHDQYARELLSGFPLLPVLQTNVFGFIDPREAPPPYRLFVSWTSCVQAARRSNRVLAPQFFRRASVAVYPLPLVSAPSEDEIQAFRRENGVAADDILVGRISRPDPVKWADLILNGFRHASRHNPKLKLLLRECPPNVAARIRAAQDAGRFVLLPSTADERELSRTVASLDVVLHISRIGESFGYAIAEPMSFGRPVITNAVPWADQAQLELVQDDCGFIASSSQTIGRALSRLARDPAERRRMGMAAQTWIRKLCEMEESLDRVEAALYLARDGHENPRAEQDYLAAAGAARRLTSLGFGREWKERLGLRARSIVEKVRKWAV